MADPLSISASIAGLVTLADAIYRTAFKYAKSAKGAPREIADLATETRDLAGVLHRLSILASALETDAEDSPPVLRLQHVVSCRTVLLRAELAISNAAAKVQSGKTHRKVAEALKWPFSAVETKEILDEVVRHKATLTLALTADTLAGLLQSLTKQQRIESQIRELNSKVKEAIHIATNIQLDENRRRVLNFFMTTNPQQSLAQSLSLRHPQTGYWLVESSEFQQWITSSTSNRLWLSGIPGAGKTILAGILISEVLKLSSMSTGVAFFFCQYKHSQTQQPIHILTTLAAQLARQNSDAYEILERYYKELQPEKGVSTDPTNWMTRGVVEKMIACFGSVYVVIDGVDECDESTADVVSMLTAIPDASSNVSICVLSRDEQEIRQALAESFLHIDIQAQSEDVNLYVAAEIDARIRRNQLRLKNMALKDEILHALVQNHGGMFRWVACQLDYICELPRDKDRREALTSLPPTLSATYERILSRLETKGNQVQQLVQRCLNLLAVADPQLTSRELREAVSIDQDTVVLDDESIVDEEAILKHCSSLVRRREGDHDDEEEESYIEFSHFSVLEYLEGPSLQGSKFEKYRVSRRDAHKVAAISCLQMLLLKDMSYCPKATSDDFRHIAMRCKRYPFFRYASLTWSMFARDHQKDPVISSLLYKLLNPNKSDAFYHWCMELYLFMIPGYALGWQGSSSPRDATVSQAAVAKWVAKFSSMTLQKGFTPLHMAATLALSDACEQLLAAGIDCNATGSLGSPLLCAVFPSWLTKLGGPVSDSYLWSDIAMDSYNHRCSVVQLLIQKGASLPDQPSTFYTTGGGRGVTLFRSCLDICNRVKNFNLLILLIEAGVSLEPFDLGEFQSVMSRSSRVHQPAPSWGAESVTNFYARLESLETEAASQLRPILLSVMNSISTTPNVTASNMPRPARASIRDLYARAALAAQHNDKLELEDILEHNSLNLRKKINSTGETILHVAVRHLSISAVETLLRRGCDQMIPDSKGTIPIWLCDRDSRLPLLRALLSRNPEISGQRNRQGESIWHLAVRGNSCRILEALFDMDPENSEIQKNNNGFTPLALALDLGKEDAASVILSRQPRACRPWTVRMPLGHLVAKSGSLKVAKAVADAGVDEFQVPLSTDGSTPLHHLQFHALPDFVRHLKMGHSNLSQTDVYGRRPIEAFFGNSLDGLASPHTPRGRPATAHTHEMLERWKKSFDELIPTDASRLGLDGKTFWERFCSVTGKELGKKSRAGMSQPVSLLMKTAVSHLLEKGIIEAHEVSRHESAMLPLASSFCDWIEPSGLLSTLTMLFNFTRCLDRAVDSQPLINLLHRGIRLNKGSMVLELLRMGVKPLASADDGYNGLEVACLCKSGRFVQMILDGCGEIGETRLNALNTGIGGLGLVHLIAKDDGTSSRYKYLHDGDEETSSDPLTMLTKAGADPNLCTASGDSAISFHVKANYISTANRLADLGADPTVRGPDGYDAITHAVLCGSSKFLSHVHHLETDGRLPTKIQWDRKTDLVWDKSIRSYGNSFGGYTDGIFRGCTLLHLAAVQNHSRVINLLLNQNLISSIDEPADGGWTAVHFAAFSGSVQCLRLLHLHGADLNAVAHCVETNGVNEGDAGIACMPLDITLANKKITLANKKTTAILEKLGGKRLHGTAGAYDTHQQQESGDDISSISSLSTVSDDFSETALPRVVGFKERNGKHSASTRELPFLPALVMRNVVGGNGPVNDPWSCGCAPLVSAIMTKELVSAMSHLENGANIDCLPCQRHGYGLRHPRGLPWLVAAMPDLDSSELLSRILTAYQAKGHSIFNGDRENPVHTSVKFDNICALRAIITHIEDNVESYRRELAKELKLGSTTINIDTVLPLILNLEDGGGFAPLHLVKSEAVTKILVEKGANVNRVYKNGDTPLLIALYRGYPQVAIHLIRHGAIMEQRGSQGETPLMVVTRKADPVMVQLLLQNHADIHALSVTKSSLLTHAAICLRDKKGADASGVFLHFLLRVGLNPNQQNVYGITPAFILLVSADLRGLFLGGTLSLNMDIVTPFPWRQMGACPKTMASFGHKSFRLLVRRYGKAVLCRVLNLHPSEGPSPLFLAAQFGFVDTLANFLSIGADVHFEDSHWQGMTALMGACEFGRLAAVRFLIRSAGARVSYTSVSTGRPFSAVYAARNYPKIVQWLLVGRYTDQEKLTYNQE